MEVLLREPLIPRRTFLSSMLIGSAFLALPAARAEEGRLHDHVAEMEARIGGRLGVSAADTHSGSRFSYRGGERFPLCSTFKTLAAALVLARVDAGEEGLDRRVVYGAEKLVTYSPTTEKHVGGSGLSLAELCEAAITLSDNTAGNLLLESFGGPQALTAWLRSVGDPATRLDRWELDLNEAVKGDPRDTTTPDAMLFLLENLAVGAVLSVASRQRLADWLIANKTGGARIRAGLPANWTVGDKTGTCGNGASGDVAVLWPPGRKPILVAAYVAEAQAPQDEVNQIFAAVGRLLASTV
jgi:beta-lactamase class A